MTSGRSNIAIPVRSVDEEDALLGSCACGGNWRLVAEEVAPLQRRWYDALVLCCSRCGSPRRAIFDITQFFEPVGKAWMGVGS